MKKAAQYSYAAYFGSARRGTRTPTQVHGLDPEPSASTNSAIRAIKQNFKK
jgi:hypothetical protein